MKVEPRVELRVVEMAGMTVEVKVEMKVEMKAPETLSPKHDEKDELIT